MRAKVALEIVGALDTRRAKILLTTMTRRIQTFTKLIVAMGLIHHHHQKNVTLSRMNLCQTLLA
jgi:hypothetical protein